MYTVLIVIHVLVAVSLIALVLLQQGKGADMGAAFGSGASATVFGARGAGSFLSRTTAVLAALFFIISIVLAALAGRADKPKSVTEQPAPAPATQTQPAVPDLPADVPQAPVDMENAFKPAPQDTSGKMPGDVPAAPAEVTPAQPADLPQAPAPATPGK
jgi:preprotein translocase subunit SecG